MKPPLLLIAGWAHPAESMQPLADLLRDVCTPTVIAASDFNPHSPIRPPAHLLGWSLGGQLALAAALAQPAAVAGLILVNTTARFTLGPDWVHGLPAGQVRALGRALRHDVASALQGFLRLSAARHGHAGPAPVDLPRAPDPLAATLAEGLRQLAETDLRPQLATLRCPALVIHAHDDAVIPLGAGLALAAGLPGARLVVCDGVGHDLPLRAPERVAEAARDFLHAHRQTS